MVFSLERLLRDIFKCSVESMLQLLLLFNKPSENSGPFTSISKTFSVDCDTEFKGGGKFLKFSLQSISIQPAVSERGDEVCILERRVFVSRVGLKDDGGESDTDFEGRLELWSPVKQEN